MARPSKNAWVAEFPRPIQDYPGDIGKPRGGELLEEKDGLCLRAKTLPDGQMLVERLDQSTVTIPIASLTPRMPGAG